MPQGRTRELRTHPTPPGGYFILTTDGAIRAKPGKAEGPASIGVVLRSPKGGLQAALSERIGVVPDHHVAEYRALLEGLRLAESHGVQGLRVFIDSALVVNQLKERARTKAPHLQPLREEAIQLMKGRDVQVCWIPRSWNTEADLLAAKALEPVGRRGRD